ncbi:MAG: small multidrug resistance family-3 protein [Gammaproteobacteria bacterium]
MEVLKIFSLFVITAIAEIVACYLPYLWLKKGGEFWLLIPAIFSMTLFVWLLTLHPQAAGRVYAAYGGVYISTAIMWLWAIDNIRPSITDLIGVGVCLFGVTIIVFGQRLV